MAMSSKVKVSSIWCLMFCLTTMATPSFPSFVFLDVYVLHMNIFTVWGCLNECKFMSMVSGSCCLHWLQKSCLRLYVHVSTLCCMMVRRECSVLCTATMVLLWCVVPVIL